MDDVLADRRRAGAGRDGRNWLESRAQPAWRIESADDGEEQGLLASAYQFSYRLALLATDSLILIVAGTVGWRMSYGIYGACMAVGIIANWFAKEPERADAVMHEKEREAPLWTPRGFFDAVVGPFIAFFREHGWLALVMLAAISLYRLPASQRADSAR